MEFTRIPRGPSSFAMDFIRPMTARRKELDRIKLSMGCLTETDCVVTILPDPTRPQKWIIVLLMGAALAYGLLTALIPAKDARPADSQTAQIRKSLADLEKRHAAGGLSAKSYRKQKGELQAKLNRASGSKKP